MLPSSLVQIINKTIQGWSSVQPHSHPVTDPGQAPSHPPAVPNNPPPMPPAVPKKLNPTPTANKHPLFSNDRLRKIAFKAVLLVDETLHPYKLTFTAESNPEAFKLYQALRDEGIPSHWIDGDEIATHNPPDGEITADEVFKFVERKLAYLPQPDKQVLRALKKSGIVPQSWFTPGGTFKNLFWLKQDGLAKTLANYHNTEASLLLRKAGKGHNNQEISALIENLPEKDWQALQAHLTAVTHYEPNNVQHYINLGHFCILRGDYAKALEISRGAMEAYNRDRWNNRGYDGEILLLQGGAAFGAGKFKEACDAYTAYMEMNPRDTNVLRLRAEANQKYLETLDTNTSTQEIASVEQEIQADLTMVVAHNAETEHEKLKEIEKQLEHLHDLTPEQKQELLATLLALGQNYLAMGGQVYDSPRDMEFVRERFNGLAASTFGLVAKYTATDLDATVQKRTDLFRGWELLALGKVDDATKTFEKIRTEIPEANAILERLERDSLIQANLAALDIWERFIQDVEKRQHAEADTTKGKVFTFLSGDWDGLDVHHRVSKYARRQKALIHKVREMIEAGEALTIAEAEQKLKQSTPAELQEAMKDLEAMAGAEGFIPPALIGYVAEIPPRTNYAESLLQQAFIAEAREGVVESPYAVYNLVKELSPDATFQGETAAEHKKALEGNSSFSRGLMKAIYSTSVEEVAAEIFILWASAGLGNLAKLRTLDKMKSMGVTGWRAVAAGRASKYLVTGHALFIGNTGMAAFQGNPDEVFTTSYLLKSYGATLIMVGFTEPLAEFGGMLAPRAAKSLGLVTKGEKLSTGGKAFVFPFTPSFGMGGMIASSETSQALDFHPVPVGGWKESLAADVVAYAKFGVGMKAAERTFGGRHQQHSKIAYEEQLALAKGHADRLGYRAETPERQAVVGLVLEASLTKAGFSGGKFTHFVEKGEYQKANEYLAQFGLPLMVTEQGTLRAAVPGEKSPHEKLGIRPPSPKKGVVGTLVERLFDPTVDLFGSPRDPRRFQAGAVRVRRGNDRLTPKADAPIPIIIEHNVAQLTSDKFGQVSMTESIGGNAGRGRLAVNIAVDAEGRIVAIGNPQDLPPEIQKRLRGKRYAGVALSIDHLSRRIDWNRSYKREASPSAQKVLRQTVEEFNRSKSGKDPAADTQPGARRAKTPTKLFHVGKKTATLEIPADASKVVISDGAGGSIEISYDAKEGVYRITNKTNRNLYLQPDSNTAPREVKPGESDKAANGYRIRMGNSWYDLITTFSADINAAHPKIPYDVKLPAHSGDLPTRSGEVTKKDSEPQDKTKVDKDPPTIVDGKASDASALNRQKWDHQWEFDANAFMQYYEQSDARQSRDSFAKADPAKLAEQTGWPRSKAEAIIKLAQQFKGDLQKAHSWLEQYNGLDDINLTGQQRALRENSLRQEILKDLKESELSNIESPELRDIMAKALKGDSSIPVPTLIEGFVSARLRNSWYNGAESQYGVRLKDTKKFARTLEILLMGAQGSSKGALHYNRSDRSFWEMRAHIDPNQPHLSFAAGRLDQFLVFELQVGAKTDVVGVFETYLKGQGGTVTRRGNGIDQIDVSANGEKWTILRQIEKGQEVVYVDFRPNSASESSFEFKIAVDRAAADTSQTASQQK